MLLFEGVKLGQWVLPCSQLVQWVGIVWHSWCILPYILAPIMSCAHLVTTMTVYMYPPKSDFCMQKHYHAAVPHWHQLWRPHTLTLQQLY